MASSVAIAAVLTSMVTLSAASVVRQPSVAGTYSLLVCRQGCRGWDTTRAYLAGTVVLLDSALRAADGQPVRARYEVSANGCFHKRELKRVRDSYAGIRADGYLLWERNDSSGRVQFSLYRSPDAGYFVSLVLTAEGAKGTGESWGAGAAEIHAPGDSVVLRRVGGAAVSGCSL